MKKLAIAATLLAVAACTKDLPQEPPPEVVVARFDPGAQPPVVPSPNDLATDPATGLLAVTLPAGASGADADFAAYLNTLNGFPADSPANTTFSGRLNPTSVTPSSVQIVDVTGGGSTPVTDATVTYADVDDKAAPGHLTIDPPTAGWTAGHSYAVALIGGASGLRGARGEPVIGSSAWALVRSTDPLAICDGSGLNCRTTTSLVPSTETDPAKKVADQGATAAKLEQLRLHYKPALDALEAAGTPRADVAQLFSFKIAGGVVSPAFNPKASPPAVPSPNDLAIDPATGLVNAPINPDDTEAMQEFTADYLNHLDGFPVSTPGSEHIVGGDLDPATLNAGSVPLIDLTAAAEADGGTTTPPAATVAYDAANHQLTVAPPATGWIKGHTYAMAIVGGESGAKGSNGEGVIASDAFALLRGANPLVDCDLTDPTTDPADCHSVLTLAPLSDADATQLEAVRLGLSPVFDGLEAAGIERGDVAVLWTFTIVDMPEVAFELPAGTTNAATVQIPFPNALLMATDGGGAQLPNPTNNPIIAGINASHLDGFSTTAPIISESSDALGALTDGAHIDPASLNPVAAVDAGVDDSGNAIDAGVLPGAPAAGLFNLDPAGEAPQTIACVNCASTLLPDGGVPENPDQLQIVPTLPLVERSNYGAYVTTALTTDEGKQVAPSLEFALLRLSKPLVDGSGASTISGLSDAQAAQLEPLRQAYQPLFDGLEAQGLPRSAVALAWTFPTETTYSSLPLVHGIPAALNVPTTPVFAADATALVLPSLGSIPHAHIGKIFQGEIPSPYALTGPGGTLNPAGAVVKPVPFTLVEPSGTAPAGGWPVVVFGHGLTRWRGDALAIADAFAAAGYATVATDVIWHGDRSFCAGSHAATGQVSDDASCADPVTQMCDESAASPTFGRCIARDRATGAAACPTGGPFPPDALCYLQHQGVCETDGKCEGGDFLRDADQTPVISGWNILNFTNLFATRDNFRQQVIDLAQLARVLQNTTAGDGTATPFNLNQLMQGQGGAALDGTKLSYAGQSLGGILGTLYTSAAPEIHNAVLNVPGGNLGQIILTSPGLADFRVPLLAGLHANGLDLGTPQFDTFFATAAWILDPSDPVNAANHLADAPADRHTLISYIENDQVMPNPTTVALIHSANRDPANPNVLSHFYQPTVAQIPYADRHGFILNFAGDASQTIAAQTEAATFISTGACPDPTVCK